ncbi:hypothetical protein BV898_11228 [Hypsibius exemplaris]|uniref:G-protein coupled receptors family 1 profile domain-containing protein n=1 Tax=Hypsibius exemplaris TaxID=2072580 RepID=A0A1W0WHE6_HYPEX|nr:hypothetical protein BV898_11228 [Hypsibius exemplaris]
MQSVDFDAIAAGNFSGMTFSFDVIKNNSLFESTSYRLPGLVTFCTYAGGLVLVLSILFNLLVILAFFRRPRLITSFTIQFLNFVIILLLTLLFDGPLNILCTLDSTLFFNPIFCALYKFGAWTFPSLALLQQMAIGLDRWSAMLAPVWHRTKTVRYGINVTMALVAYYLVLYLPLFAVDTVRGAPDGKRCDYHHALRQYQVFVRIATYYLPLGFTYVSYPVLLVLLRKRRNGQIQAAAARAKILERTTQIGVGRISSIPMRRPHRILRSRSVPLDAMAEEIRNGRFEGSSLDLGQLHGERPLPEQQQQLQPTQSSKMRRRKLNLSMWMMFVQIVCSLPLTVTYTLIQYFEVSHSLPYLDDINVFAILLTAVNIMIDPVMYWIFFRDIRMETLKLLRCNGGS